jgi:predicted DNA binding protein
MSVSHKFKSDAHIMNRRAVEAREAVLHNAINGDKNMFLKATWEAKTDNKIIKKIARDRMSDLRARQESNLQERRAKLAQLLASEDQ